MFFVDTSVLLDVLLRQEPWVDWSSEALATARDSGPLVINPIVYAEASVRFSTKEFFDQMLPLDDFAREPIPDDAAFVAGKAFVAYRRRGGQRTSMLPDFLIGAHAAVRGYRLLTRDVRRYRTYFPTLRLIAPD